MRDRGSETIAVSIFDVTLDMLPERRQPQAEPAAGPARPPQCDSYGIPVDRPRPKRCARCGIHYTASNPEMDGQCRDCTEVVALIDEPVWR